MFHLKLYNDPFTRSKIFFDLPLQTLQVLVVISVQRTSKGNMLRSLNINVTESKLVKHVFFKDL